MSEHDGNQVTAPPTATPESGMEDQEPGTGFGVSAITRRWRREDLLKRGGLALRGIGLLFSLLAFIIMASNKHGDWMDFDKYEEYRYLLGIAILSTLYTGIQTLRHVHELSTGKSMLQPRTSALVDFVGDQIIAYLLISASSTAIPLTNSMRRGADNIFTDSSSAAIGMAFLGFFSLALAALISGYKLSARPYL
ncbi:CASP-like protein 4B1 [Tripterygium wilfordii]|uniref:CASP-like protein 4B1 n=1 Tax=Tripterygium wilfordii TaxID=458696 RepID=UPI0018F82997|nr:CASP-like protein 4B1 [Tripterygium wilfordii]